MIIDEQKEVELLKEKKNKKCTPIKAIWLLAKEQVTIGDKNKADTITHIENLLKSGVVKDYNEVKYIDTIPNIVNKCMKNNYKLKVVECVYISQKELDVISKIETKTMQRLAFGFLFNAKVENAKRGEKLDDNGNFIKYSNNVYSKTGTIFRECVNTKGYSKLDQEIMVGKLMQMGLLELKNANYHGDLYRRVLCIDDAASENNHVFKICHFDNYIHHYNNYIGEGNYTECEICGKIVKKKNNRVKYCDECYSEEKKELDRIRMSENRKNSRF
jgi:hypothetical protein